MTTEVHQEMDLVTVREAARRLGCSTTNVYSLIHDGEIPVVTVGQKKGYRIDPADLQAFIDQRKEAKQGPSRNGVPPRPRLKHISF